MNFTTLLHHGQQVKSANPILDQIYVGPKSKMYQCGNECICQMDLCRHTVSFMGRFRNALICSVNTSMLEEDKSRTAGRGAPTLARQHKRERKNMFSQSPNEEGQMCP